MSDFDALPAETSPSTDHNGGQTPKPTNITLAETLQAKVDLQDAIRDALCAFTATTGIKIDMIYVQPYESFGDFKVQAVKYHVDAAVKL